METSLIGGDAGEETLLKMKIMKNNNLWTYNKIRPFLGTRILEIGAGMGTISDYLATEDRTVTLIEKNCSYAEFLRKKFAPNRLVNILNEDVIDINGKMLNLKLDTVVGINVLEHIYDDLTVLKKIRPLLNVNGKLLLVVPAHKFLFSQFDANLLHYRRYSKKDLIGKLKVAGFTIEKIEYINFLSSIGWFINFKLLNRKRMSLIPILLADKLIFLIALAEKFIKLPFGLSLLVVARRVI